MHVYAKYKRECTPEVGWWVGIEEWQLSGELVGVGVEEWQFRG